MSLLLHQSPFLLHLLLSFMIQEIDLVLEGRSSSQLNQSGQGSKRFSSSMDSSNTITQSYKYDVFISFRGSDTRFNFVDHLYAHLSRKGIFTFRDDTMIEKGAYISPNLHQAIRHSRLFIIVFSKDYAASTWCLDEIAAIIDCHKKSKQILFPIFYMDPSHVRKQNGVYENAFLSHTQKYDSYDVDRWRSTLTYLAGIVGWDVRNKPLVEEIEEVTQCVIKKLGHVFSESANDLIGLQPHVEALENLLQVSSKVEGSRVLGIWGMSGIGKTTLAKVLYDRISYQFDAFCFIENVSQIYEDGGAIAVQNQILHQAIGKRNLDTYSLNSMHNIKLLLVLDDVGQFEQLQELHIIPKLLHARSRIIITTRDEHILKQYGVESIHEAQLMNDKDAHKLLCRKAFKSDYPSSGFAELVAEVLKHAQGLPLAITEMGSFLFSRNATEWRATLDKFQNYPRNKTMKMLHVCFEELEKEMFMRGSSSIQSYSFDVFISFSGPDTRKTIVKDLYTDLTTNDIVVFKDDTQLEKGESLSPQLLQAIQYSRISIILFSKNYASSSWCLDEMAAIADCHKEQKQIVFPVFYVDPSHVLKQNGVYEDAFLSHTDRFRCDLGKVDRWRRAMTYLAGLDGWDVRNESDGVIAKIAEAVRKLKKLGHKLPDSTDDLIGVQPRVELGELNNTDGVHQMSASRRSPVQTRKTNIPPSTTNIGYKKNNLLIVRSYIPPRRLLRTQTNNFLNARSYVLHSSLGHSYWRSR